MWLSQVSGRDARGPSQSRDAQNEALQFPANDLKLGELSIGPQPAHAAVRKNIKPQVRNDPGIQQLALKEVSGVGLQFGAGQNALPDY